MKQLSDKDEGRLNYLIHRNFYSPKKLLVDYQFQSHLKTLHNIEAREAHALFDLKEVTDTERYKIWTEAYSEQLQRKAQMRLSPDRIRQDNKATINYGSGNPGSYTIRYPKKVRKTAWKRFYKLFPFLKPKSE